jgi:hypothetical protein
LIDGWENMQVDKCKLCLGTKELCDSHYLPKSIYRSGLAKELKNPNPVVIANGQWKQISDQLRGYVFCAGCEEKLNKNGETWVMARTPHRYEEIFPLQKALLAIERLAFQERLDVYQVRGKEGFDLDQLIYFGLSVFWRGSVHHWKSTGGAYAQQISLGEYEEPLRLFLLGKGSLPGGVVLTVDVWPYSSRHQISYPVEEFHMKQCRRYWFVVPGLLYRLYLEETIPAGVKNRNLIDGIVGVDRDAIDRVLELTRERLKENWKGPKIDAMFQEIERIRSKTSSTE